MQGGTPQDLSGRPHAPLMGLIDFICWDCGTDFAVHRDATSMAGPGVTCPRCGGGLVTADPAVIRRWRPGDAEPSAGTT